MLAVWLCLSKISASRTRTHACAPTRARTETHTHGRPLGRADLEPMEVGRRIAAARHVPYELIEVVRLRTVRAATYRVLHVAYSMFVCCMLRVACRTRSSCVSSLRALALHREAESRPADRAAKLHDMRGLRRARACVIHPRARAPVRPSMPACVQAPWVRFL